MRGHGRNCRGRGSIISARPVTLEAVFSLITSSAAVLAIVIRITFA